MWMNARFAPKLAVAICLLFAAMLVSSQANAPQRTLRLATEAAYPPFNSVDANGALSGFDIDIGNALCDEMKVKCEWIQQDWDGMIPALQAGKFDAIMSSMFITDERRKQIDFTKPYYRTPAAFIAAKTSPVKGMTPDDLAGLTVGVQGSSVYETYVEKILPGSQAKAYGAVPDMLTDLANGRLDVVNDDLVVLDQFLKSPEGACCKLLGAMEPLPEIHGPGAGIAVRKGDPLRDEFDRAIDALRADGRFKTINDTHFDFTIDPGKN